jgi:hypothetical protein
MASLAQPDRLVIFIEKSSEKGIQKEIEDTYFSGILLVRIFIHCRGH